MATGRGIEAAALGMRQRAGAAPIGMNRTPNEGVLMATGREIEKSAKHHQERRGTNENVERHSRGGPARIPKREK